MPASGDPYWAETARGLFAGILAYVLESKTVEDDQRTIKSALKMFSRGRPLHLEMRNILKEEPDLNDFIKDKFRQHTSREEKARQSFEFACHHRARPLEQQSRRRRDQSVGLQYRRSTAAAVHPLDRDAGRKLRVR